MIGYDPRNAFVVKPFEKVPASSNFMVPHPTGEISKETAKKPPAETSGIKQVDRSNANVNRAMLLPDLDGN